MTPDEPLNAGDEQQKPTRRRRARKPAQPRQRKQVEYRLEQLDEKSCWYALQREFENIEARAKRLYRTTGQAFYRQIRDEAHVHAADLAAIVDQFTTKPRTGVQFE